MPPIRGTNYASISTLRAW